MPYSIDLRKKSSRLL